jgi:hypothetical protein
MHLDEAVTTHLQRLKYEIFILSRRNLILCYAIFACRSTLRRAYVDVVTYGDPKHSVPVYHKYEIDKGLRWCRSEHQVCYFL